MSEEEDVIEFEDQAEICDEAGDTINFSRGSNCIILLRITIYQKLAYIS